MKTAAATAFCLLATSAAAHPGHGGKGWIHQHQDDLVDAALIAFACLVAVYGLRIMWKVVAK
jgi:hypothetical protein